ncbi:MAG: c-type cytochrome domain-containing protein, partial [Pirellulales bacterium]
MRHSKRSAWFGYLCLIGVGLWGTIGAGPLVAQKPIANEQEQSSGEDLVMQKVFAIWERHCFRCHGSEKQEGGLRLDIRARAIEGGDSGRAWVGRDSQASLLIQYITSEDESKRMPPEGTPLNSEEVRLLREWIDGGASWPESFEGRIDRKKHWAFEPIVRRDPPQLKMNVSQRPIDRFVRHQLSVLGLTPSPQADRSTLIRRLALDLTGLLPTTDEVESFLQDASDEAYEKIVDHY